MVAFTDEKRFRNLLLTWPEKALRFLYEAYFESLLLISTRVTHDPVLAEEVVRDSFVQIWRNHRALASSEESSIQYYLVRTVKTRSTVALRDSRNIHRSFLSGEYSRFPTDTDIVGLSYTGCFQLVLKELTARQRQCFFLRYEVRMSVEEIADHLNISTRTVERRLRRAKRVLYNYRWAF